MSDSDDFFHLYAKLLKRRASGGPAITDSERIRLFAARDVAWEKYWREPVIRRDTFVGHPQQPPSKDDLELEFGAVGQADQVKEPAARRQGRKLSKETDRELMKRLRQRKKNPEGNTQRRIADDLGISPTTVQRRWARMQAD